MNKYKTMDRLSKDKHPGNNELTFYSNMYFKILTFDMKPILQFLRSKYKIYTQEAVIIN